MSGTRHILASSVSATAQCSLLSTGSRNFRFAYGVRQLYKLTMFLDTVPATPSCPQATLPATLPASCPQATLPATPAPPPAPPSQPPTGPPPRGPTRHSCHSISPPGPFKSAPISRERRSCVVGAWEGRHCCVRGASARSRSSVISAATQRWRGVTAACASVTQCEGRVRGVRGVNTARERGIGVSLLRERGVIVA